MMPWPTKLAAAILYRAAQDITDSNKPWLDTASCQDLCAQSGVAHPDYKEAVLYILGQAPVQKVILLQRLKKKLKAK